MGGFLSSLKKADEGHFTCFLFGFRPKETVFMYIEIQITTIRSFDAIFFFSWGTYIHANNVELTKSLWYKIIDKVTISPRNCTFGQDHV